MGGKGQAGWKHTTRPLHATRPVARSATCMRHSDDEDVARGPNLVRQDKRELSHADVTESPSYGWIRRRVDDQPPQRFIDALKKSYSGPRGFFAVPRQRDLQLVAGQRVELDHGPKSA